MNSINLITSSEDNLIWLDDDILYFYIQLWRMLHPVTYGHYELSLSVEDRVYRILYASHEDYITREVKRV